MTTSSSKNSVLIVAIGLLGAIALLGAILAFSYISAANNGNYLENVIKAAYADNQNKLAQYSQKVMEAVQVPAMMRDDLEKVAKAAIEGRYGADGSKAVFQAITESNPQLDPALYRSIQQIIESGRTEFEKSQTSLIDKKRVYSTALGTFWGGMWLRLAGYPKINLDDYKIITTDRTQDVFNAGKESAPLQLRPESK